MQDLNVSIRRPWLNLAFCGLLMLNISAQAATFRTSSIGYHPKGSKVAILEDVTSNKKLEIYLFDPIRRNPKFPVLLGANVFKITKIRELQSQTTQQGPTTHSLLLDFSDFKEPGSYEIRVEGAPEIKSEPIKLNDFLYWDTLKPVVKAFYYQRCGQEVEERNNKMYHAACHLKDADFIHPTHQAEGETGEDVVGGWHNGGDYAKYVTSTAITASKLMAMNEWNPKPFKFFHIDYPLYEPGYGQIDDLHHEIQAGLDWLMSMQRKDGALYRKVAGKQWPGKVKPEDDSQRRYLYGYSTQDTAIAAATWAIAARDFKKADLGYSVKCVLAAEKAWAFLDDRQDPWVQETETDFSGSGEFKAPGKLNDMPYRLWAAAELYTATGKSQYQQFLIAHLPDVPVQRFSWMNPSLQGLGDYLLYAKNQDAASATSIRAGIITLADQMISRIEQDPYGTGLNQYGSSSNMDVAENGSALMLAYRLSGNEKYRAAASQLVSYFFGLNPKGMTYITGLPGKSVQHPSHRWMEVSDKVLTGFLVDGPNNAPFDSKTPKGKGPASYIDDAAAKSVNEPKLLNNASLAYLLSVLNESYNTASNPEEAGPKSPLDYELAPERPKKKSATPASTP